MNQIVRVFSAGSWQVVRMGSCMFAASLVIVAIAELAGAKNLDLTIVRDVESSKPIFRLNGAPFYPLIYAEQFSSLSPAAIATIVKQGFNALQVGIDTEDTASSSFKELMAACTAAHLPVFLELNDWRIREELIERPELNMVMSNGERVKYFPDFANPETRREHIRRFAPAARRTRPYLGRPIIAISVGAYDAFHLPDAEVHVDFVVPPHTKHGQTQLPYGKHAEVAFRRFVAERSSKDDGLEKLPAMPTARAEASNDQEWRLWLQFRRQLVADWLRATVRAVRQQAAVPIGVSYDLNFAERERFATPPAAWRGILDFVSVYCYGRTEDARYIPRLMRTVRREFRDEGVPMIGFLEFSSGLAGKALGDAYAKECAPFVSGLMVTGPVPDRKHPQARVESFVGWAKNQDETALLAANAPAADVLLVVNRDGVELGRTLQKECSRSGITVDVLYANREWTGDGIEGYGVVAIDDELQIPPDFRAGRDQQIVDRRGLLEFLRESLPTVSP